MRPRRLVTALLALVLAAAHAEPPPSPLEPQFASVPVPRDVVGSLAQDRAGFLWVGTSDGLARFDGYRLRAIERAGDSAVQRNLGWVRSLAAARDGRVWIGTEINGLAVYDPDSDRVTLLGSLRGQDAAAHVPIRALAEDGQGQVWIGSLGDGLVRYDPASRRFTAQPLPVNGEPERRVLALLAARDGSVWAGHWQGLARRAAGSDAWQELPLPARAGRSGVATLLEDEQGRVWFGTADGELGVVQDGQPRWLPLRLRGAVQSLALAGDGMLWAGLSDGIAWIDPQRGTWVQQLRHRPQLASGLAGNDVSVLLRDQTGSVWVGGYGVGLQRHRHTPAVAVRGPDADPQSPLASADLRLLLARRDGHLLVASHSGPVAELDGELRTLGRWPREADTPVEALAESTDGASIWLVTQGRLEWRNAASARLRRSWPLEGGRAHRLLVLPGDEVWVGMQDGAYRLAGPLAAQVERVRRSDGEPLRGGVHALRVEPATGTLWVGALAGLFRWQQGALHPLPTDPAAALGFPAVLGLLFGRDGTLWVDTSVSGLHRLSGYDGQGRARFQRISERLGAPGQPFGVNLHEDAQGRIWTQQAFYDPRSDRLYQLSGAEGAALGTPRFFADAELPDGRLLFGGSRGLLVLRPQAFEVSGFAPPVVLSSLRRNGQPWSPDTLRNGLQLPPDTKTLTIEFAALDFTDPQRLRYEYRLDGVDTDWTATDASARFASYGGLQPGRYTFRVRATNHHGVWSANTLSLPLEVQAAWWQTGWARFAAMLLMAGAVGGVIVGGVRLRTRQLRRREHELQELVDLRTAELREASLTDTLTGLRNRRYLDLRIDKDLQYCLRHHETPGSAREAEDSELVLLLMDLDHFKKINDQHGHAAGDAVLVQFADRLREVFRGSDIVVRWGGEEFLALARGSPRDRAGELAGRVLEAVRSRPFRVRENQPLGVTVSIGFVVFPLDPMSPRAWDWDATLNLADGALYAAKAQGRDGFVGACQADGLVPDEAPDSLRDWLVEPRLTVERSRGATLS